MQDVALSPSLNENTGRNSHIDETDYEIRSNPSTPPTEQQQHQEAELKLPLLRSDAAVNMKITPRNLKPNNYEPPVSDRESWWRTTIKDTPIPGTYNTHLNTFIKEIVARPMTYGFKSDGRRRDPQPLEPKGKELLPGAYSVEDFVERMNQLRLSYGFKGPERESLLKKTMAVNQDKDIDVPPGLYETQKYNTINVPVESARHSVFKSKTTRKLFLPKIGPAPGDYEPKTNVTNVHSPTITSSFRSRTDRFHRKLAKVPGPGTYDKLTIFPTPKQINTLSMRGVFFNANYAHKAATAI
ncbi:unnamed protein product [Rotaria sp. Silwood1]|nr:unnamed protein product [Rotaria sp. Silwood1]CAF0997597.1 unnamed protein product [Rotaria sp. Silwood1]CAF3395657.1 unnamed protein product [Rotaria sp. Silwood1]CAF3407125.1 unnamed protein product [Rotaria sp. Silwood1]CAF4489842.1 unnamed protein product [Rotaria sp. Silwood1]